MSVAGRCLVVVVLYRMFAQDSTTVRGLVHAMENDSRLRNAYSVLLWDNTPCSDLPTDQDTAVTSAYLEGMLGYQQRVYDAADVAAIVPVLFDKELQLSPKQVLRFRDQPIEPTGPGILEGEVFAANSGVTLRVSALHEIGGYSRDFWLDHSDMYVFHQLYLRRMRVFFASDLSLQHRMTMLDYDGSMSPARYENFLMAEQAFIDLYKSRAENAVQMLRLLMRVFRQYRRYRNQTYSKMTLNFLLHRLRTSKAGRMRNWKLRADERKKRSLSNGSEPIH